MLSDIIHKYQLTISIISSSANSKIQLQSIINFFKFCEDKNQSHLYSKFVRDFLPYIINIYKNSAIDFIDPYYLIASKHLLYTAKHNEQEDIIIEEINSVIEILNFHLLILYYHLGEIDNGIIILNDLLNSKTITDSGVSIDYLSKFKNSINTKSALPVDPALFKVNKAFDILRRVNYELNKINSYSNHFINILLVESDNANYGLKNFGIIQELACNINKKSKEINKDVFLENIIDAQGDSIEKIKKPLINSANIILNNFDKKLNLNNNFITLKFAELKGIYKGTSFGAGAALLIAASYLSDSNSRIQFQISGSSAFTGSIDEKGDLIKLSKESIESKLEAAFFSWIKYVILPAENLNDANDKLSELQKKYNRKHLSLIGIKNITEVLENKNVIKIEKDSMLQYSQKVVQLNKNLSYSIFSLILILLTVLIVYNIIPRKFKPLPQTIRPLNIIYTPDRDTIWKFNNGDLAGGDTIGFGEISIGDALIHKFDLWNDDDSKAPIRAEIQGKDKDEFEILWGVDNAQVESPEYTFPDIRQRMFIKFIPYKSEGNKRAELVFYNSDKPKQKKIIYLQGSAGIYKTGYSVKFKGDDYGIINPARGNILGKEFAISFWFKTNKENLTLLASENSKWTLTKFNLRITNSILDFEIIPPKSQGPINTLILSSKSKILPNYWNFVTIAHNNNLTNLTLNDEVVSLQTEEEQLPQIEDYFRIGTDFHPIQIKDNALNYRKDGWELSLAEFRIYNTSLNQKEISERKYKREYYGDKKLLCYLDFEEGLAHYVFDKTNNDINLELFGQPERTLDRPPLNEKPKPIIENDIDKYVKVEKKGMIVLNKNLFDKRSSFTIQLDAKSFTEEKEKVRSIFKIETLEKAYNWYFLNDDSLFIQCSDIKGSKQFAAVGRKVDDKWHKYTFDYSAETNKGRLFIDSELIAEYSFEDRIYDITRQQFCIFFGNNKNFDNPRYISETTAIDNIAIFNRTLNNSEIKLNNPSEIKSLSDILGFWSFSKIDGNICYDEINHYPVFIWDEFEVLNK